MTATDANSTSKIGDIQILRAVAIALVLLYHLSLTATAFSLTSFTMPFWAGVELFFVISGFVVTRSCLERPCTAWDFLRRRAFRLYPAILFFLAVSAVVSFAASRLDRGSWGYSYLAVETLDFVDQSLAILSGTLIDWKGTVSYHNGAMWSLSVEFQFYLAFALFLLVCSFGTASQRRLERLALSIALALYALTLANRVGIWFGREVFEYGVIAYIRQWRMDFMLLGVVVAILPRYPMRFGTALAPALLIVPLLVASMSEPALSAGRKPMLVGLTTPLMGLCFAGLVYLAATGSAVRWKDNFPYRFLMRVGDWSYSIYLLHFPIFAGIWMLFYVFFPFVMNSAVTYGVCQAIMCLLVTFPVAALSFTFVEIPGQRAGRSTRGVSLMPSRYRYP